MAIVITTKPAPGAIVTCSALTQACTMLITSPPKMIRVTERAVAAEFGIDTGIVIVRSSVQLFACIVTSDKKLPLFQSRGSLFVALSSIANSENLSATAREPAHRFSDSYAEPHLENGKFHRQIGGLKKLVTCVHTGLFHWVANAVTSARFGCFLHWWTRPIRQIFQWRGPFQRAKLRVWAGEEQHSTAQCRARGVCRGVWRRAVAVAVVVVADRVSLSVLL